MSYGTTDNIIYVSVNKDTGTLLVKNKGGVQEANYIEGFLVGIQEKKDTYEGNELHKIIFILKDNIETYWLQMGFHSNNSHTILNCLSSLNDYDMVGRRFKFTFKKKEKYFRVWVADPETNELINWKYQPEDIPKTEIIKIKNKEIVDTEARDNFFTDLFKALQSKFKKEPEKENYETDPDIPF